MRLPKTETSKASKIVLAAGIVLILTGAAVFLFWDDAPPPRPLPAKAAAAPPAPAFTATEASAPISQGDYLNSSADLRTLTELQANLEVEKLNVAIAEQKARLNELGASPGTALPQIVAMPGAELNDAVQGAPVASERVLSVQGLGGLIMATLETPDGLKTVKVGDRVGYGQVERISIAGVEIRDGDELRLISVEE